MNLLELLQLARKAVETARTHDLLRHDSSQVSVEEMMVWLKGRLASLPCGEPVSSEDLFCEQIDPARRVALFLAMLEMARVGAFQLDQRGLFDPILINGHTSHLCHNVEHEGRELVGG